MKNNKEFDDILNLCLDQILKGHTVDECLHSYPEMAAELEPLLRTAVAAKVASEVQPRAEFKSRARYEFQSAIRAMESKKSRRSLFSGWHIQWQSGWAMALIAILFVAIGGAGTVMAASNSMPDSVLYPVKIATENVQMALTFSDIGKAELNAKLADRRVNEIVYVAAKGNSGEVQIVASRLNNNLLNISNLMGEEVTAATSYGTENGQRNNTDAKSGVNSPPMLAAGAPTPGTGDATPPATAIDNLPPMTAPVPADQGTTSINALPASSLPAFVGPEATNVSIHPVFSWPAVDGVTGYEFQLADNPAFSSPIEIQINIATNSWISRKTLEYNKTYYWRVRTLDMNNKTMGDWIPNTFTTEPGIPVVTPSPTLPPVTPTSSPTIGIQNSGPISQENLTDLEKLKQTILQYALTHPALLEDALSKAPAEVRPALRQAITQALAEYDKLAQEFQGIP